MAWEIRARSKYYYRSERRDGRVVKVYCGSGARAALAAQNHASAKAARESDRSAARRLQEEFGLLDGQMMELDKEIDRFAASVLVASGLYKHHGTWRPHGRKYTNQTADPIAIAKE